MTPAIWAGVVTFVLIMLLYAIRPALLRLAGRLRERRQHHAR